jgi:hypothetical protein
VQWTIEESEKVEGRTYDQEGNALTEGTILARLDTTRYELAISSAEAKLAAIHAQADAAQIEIEQVLRERLKAGEAELARAKMDLKRAIASCARMPAPLRPRTRPRRISRHAKPEWTALRPRPPRRRRN